jgi:hypothetical protein
MSLIPETVSSAAGLVGSHAADVVDKGRTSLRKRRSKRKVENLTCNEGEVEDLLSEGEST